MATERQIAFMQKLMAEKLATNARGEVDPEGRTVAQVMDLLGEDGLAKYWEAIAAKPTKDVSAIIDRLMAAPKVQAARPASNGNGPEVPAGRYATASRTGNNDLDFWKIDRPTSGKWEGYTFVKRIIGGHDDQPVRGAEAKAAKEAIVAAGIEASGLLYAQESENCRRCGRHLTVEASRHQGYGPECIKKVG